MCLIIKHNLFLFSDLIEGHLLLMLLLLMLMLMHQGWSLYIGHRIVVLGQVLVGAVGGRRPAAHRHREARVDLAGRAADAIVDLLPSQRVGLVQADDQLSANLLLSRLGPVLLLVMLLVLERNQQLVGWQ